MIDAIKKRYANKWHANRAHAHFLLTGVITAFWMPFIPWVGLAFPFVLEAVQAAYTRPWDWFDSLFDLCEGLTGGLVVGGIFWVRDLWWVTC